MLQCYSKASCKRGTTLSVRRILPWTTIDCSQAMMIMRHMCSSRGKHSSFPYAIIITTIHENFDISTIGESKIEPDARDNKIDVDVIQKIGFFQDPIDMHFKHCNDQLDSPADVLTSDQPHPQLSQFHVESSSSMTMLTNQMIMD
ncbi:hypothetical protein Lal_00038054 [Lupinus albus]|nr:hypothetical protein Lal_00038054 [Lupinus albus]